MTARDLANREQRRASNPAVSAFVSASAGSGKTKLLTDRLLRLMLAGTPPEKILCLTYTKAAAAEMAIRLNKRLGQWVVWSDEKLNSDLTILDVPVNATSRSNARKLFADVLDLPGGMKINTIHAFCQSLLRRFPLEAKLSPHFELEDEYQAASRLREAREQALGNPAHRDNIFSLAEETNEQEFADLTAKFSQENELLALLQNYSPSTIMAMQRAALNAPEKSYDQIMLDAVTLTSQPTLTLTFRRLVEAGNPSGAVWARKCLEWLDHLPATRLEKWSEWVDSHFTAKGTRRILTNFFGKNLAHERDVLAAEIDAEHARIETIENARRTAKLVKLNADLLSLLAPILQSDNVQKSEQATVTYADLISITLNLLKKPEDIAWILYKLDGGIDHLLLDEVQDTAPAQWQIADAIAGEFFAGSGARSVDRTIFAVGDVKQSIFSFQGANLQSFLVYRDKFRRKVQAAEQFWLDGSLSVSFRSTEPVLKLVDAVFAQPTACFGVCEPGSLIHNLSRLGQGGAVCLWPLTKSMDTFEAPEWAVPDDYTSAQSAKSVLANEIAQYIRKLLSTRAMLPSRARAVTPGDFLILVRRRDELVTAITRACKENDIPIAGLDRMILTQQQALSDLLALCGALLLPADDLAFGQFLASPLGGLTDESLMALAIGRRGTLATALFARRTERPDWAVANAFFQTLRQQVDYISPYALLSQALGPLGGRAKLLQRLGPDAAEPIDEILAEAQNFTAANPASLQNFVFTLRHSGASIKREAEAGGDMVRIMTVHGAKGLQAPIVILPDTTTIPKPNDKIFQLDVPQQELTVPIFCPRADLRSNAVLTAFANNAASLTAEYNRLLYVALTRAEDQLIICGAEGRKTVSDNCWYNLVKAGFEALECQRDDAGLLEYSCPQTTTPDSKDKKREITIAHLPSWAGSAPDWLATPPTAETTRPEPMAPSRNTEEPAKHTIAISPLDTGFTATRDARTAALAKGRIIHSLLQHLPQIPAAERREASLRYLAQPGLELPIALKTQILDSLLMLLEHPALAKLFGPGSKAEVPLAGVVGEVEIGGLVDRLVITPSEIIIADYKTDRLPPASPEAIPMGYVRQLAAYSGVLSQIFPERLISCLLIWTETAAVMEVPVAMITRHAPPPGQPYA